MGTLLGSIFTDKNQQVMFDTKIKYVKVLVAVLVSKSIKNSTIRN